MSLGVREMMSMKVEGGRRIYEGYAEGMSECVNGGVVYRKGEDW